MRKKEKLVPGEYIVNVEKKTVVYTVKAHGAKFVGVAKCGPNDPFDVERGKAIAHIRATIAQRKFDLELTRQFIFEVKALYDYMADRNNGIVSPHFMHSIQRASEEQKAQLAHIRDLKKRLEAYL